MDAIVADDSLVVLMRQCYFIDSLSVNIMCTTADIHLLHLRLVIEKVVLVIVKSVGLLNECLLHPPCTSSFGILDPSCRNTVWLSGLTNSVICWPPASSLNIPMTLLLIPVSMPDR